MLIDQDGTSLWYGTADAPAPEGVIEDGLDIAVTIAVRPPDAYNAVEVRYRIDGGPVRSVAARWLHNVPGRDVQYFRARFPPLRPGDQVQYAAVCRCAGRLVPADSEASRLPASFRVAGGPEPVLAEAGSSISMPASFPTTRARSNALRTPTETARARVSPARRRDDDEGPVTLPEYSIKITSPPNGWATRPGVPLTVLGKTCKSGTVTITGVGVQLGEGNAFEPATQTGSGWTSWSFTSSVSETGPLKITAQVTVRFPPQVTGTAKNSVSILLDGIPPSLTVSEPTQGLKLYGPGPSFGGAVDVEATDQQSGVTKVEIIVDGGAPQSAVHILPGNRWIKDYHVSVGQHEITIRATDKAGNATTATRTIAALDAAAPTLSIDSPDPFPTTVTWPAQKSIEMIGTAVDLTTGVQKVDWKLGSEGFEPAENISGNWSKWRVVVELPRLGTHEIVVRAIDKAGNESRSTHEVTVAVPLELKDASLVSYLEDLVDFASRRARTAPSPQGEFLDESLLAETFQQPFDRLIGPAIGDAGTRVVRQVRICIEVLRRFRGNQPAEGEERYRQAAYDTVLRNLGTSYEEIRLARAADDDVRKALAGRLGIDLGPSRPDALDDLFLPPERLAEADAEADLEAIFGLIDTRWDPLSSTTSPDLLLWRRARLRTLWREQDYAGEPSAEAQGPIIDPDLIREADIKGPPSDNEAFELWETRRSWVDEELNTLRDKREQGFASVLTSVLGTIDLEDLATQHADGADIAANLEAYGLSLPPFLHLVRIGRLAATGTVLEAEWEDVLSILVQVKKQRDMYTQWREEEETPGVTLGPDHFQLAAAETRAPVQPADLPRWRASAQARRRWEHILEARFGQDQAVKDSLTAALLATEEATLPLLREMLVASIEPPTDGVDIADWLTQRLQIDVKTTGAQKTTRVHQAIESLQGVLFSLRTERFDHVEPLQDWHLVFSDTYAESDFDHEWRWMGAYGTWRAAMLVFAYPENYLLPSLRDPTASAGENLRHLQPSQAFWTLVDNLRGSSRLTPGQARQFASEFLTDLRSELGTDLPLDLQTSAVKPFILTERLSDEKLAERRNFVRELFTGEGLGAADGDLYRAPAYLKEIFYFVPIQMALQLQKAGHYLAAIDWIQTVYAYNRPEADRRIYYGLVQDGNVTTQFQRPDMWLIMALNPHEIVGNFSPRANAYTRFTVMALVRCILDFADAEFTRATGESIPRARALYLAATDLLDYIEIVPANGEQISPFPPNPVPASLRLHAEINLFKLRSGRNIAGLERETVLEPSPAPQSIQLTDSGVQIVVPSTVVHRPTPYRFAALIARAKELVGIAQQIETAFLSTVEKRDAEAYSLLQARQHIGLANATVALQELRVIEASRGIDLARLQQDRASIQSKKYDQWINGGLNIYEKNMLYNYKQAKAYRDKLAYADAALTTAQAIAQASGSGILGTGVGAAWSGVGVVAAASLARAHFSTEINRYETLAQEDAIYASHERRKDEWELAKSLADKDQGIASKQVTLAGDQKRIVEKERDIAKTQISHAEETANFLVEKFTNQELYEWMSGILGSVYAFFLNQATATAALAQSQLAFERQEMQLAFIQTDYWQSPSEAAGTPPAGSEETPDRRGLTGSARLLQDIYRLDQRAFETRKRLLQLSHTVSLARLAPYEFQLFRETGELSFATPMELFDRGFPGHYLRLIRRVRLSIVALIPPTHGVRATLAASGLSRVVIAGDVFSEAFQTIFVRRSPEQIAFTSPVNASGLLELEPEGDLLLPFESMGVDTTWRLELPRAANPFDYGTMADVLFTLDYTALEGTTYREQIIHQLDPSVSADRSFSFRHEFADAFYDLSNPREVGEPILSRFTTRREDFPPNIDDLRMQHVLMYFVRSEEANLEDGEGSFGVPVAHFLFEPKQSEIAVGGEAASTADGVISTRRGNGAAWLPMLGHSPVGSWELALPEEMRPRLEDGEIEDILFVVTYSGHTPPWPA